MDGGKSNSGENLPSLISPVQENDLLSLATWQNNAAGSTGIFHEGVSARADPLSFPYTPFRCDPFPWKHMHGAYQPHNTTVTSGNLMIDLNQLHNLQNPMIDLNSINMESNIHGLYSQDLPFPEGDEKGVGYNCDSSGASDSWMNDECYFGSFQNPDINPKLQLVGGNAGGGYGIALQGGVADNRNILQRQSNCVGLGGIETMLNQTQSTGEINFGNRPQNIDGSFLSLGIGGMEDAQFKSDLRSREIDGKQDGAVYPHLNTSLVRQGTGTSLNTGDDLVGQFSSFQNNVGGLTTLGHNVGGWTLPNNNNGVTSGTYTGLRSSPFPSLQKAQAEMQQGFPKSYGRNLGFVDNRDSRHANLDPCKAYKGQLTSSSRPSAGLLDSGQNGPSCMALESGNLTWTTTQPTSDQLRKHFMKTVHNVSSESSAVSPFIGFISSSSRQEHSGKFFQPSQDSTAQVVDASAQLPRRKRVQPAGHLFPATDGAVSGPFPKRIGVQVTKETASQAAGTMLFPQRLGIEINENSAARAAGDGLFLKNAGNQVTRGGVAYASEHRLYPKERGYQTTSQPVLFSTDLRGPSFNAGCSQGLPIHLPNDILGPSSTSGQVITPEKGYGLSQASNVIGRSSLKSSAIIPPTTAPRIQRKRIARQTPLIPPSIPSARRQTAPTAAIPAHVAHIKWQGSEGLPQGSGRLPRPTGHKCMLCKRDVSFTPDGPVQQPAVSPAVAILPCGHTFHDHCLQLITPQDQSKNPPCIPCAIGET